MTLSAARDGSRSNHCRKNFEQATTRSPNLILTTRNGKNSLHSNCIFCRIVAGEAPCHRIYQDDRVLVFMDIFPVTDGHTLIIPREHFENIYETSEDDLAAVARISVRVAAAIRKTLAPDGLGVFQLNGAAAGQTVFHYHMHLMPRTVGGSLALHTRVPGDPERLAELAGKLAAAM